MYCMKRPVTYSEVGADYKADMAQVINYFQDCSCFQSDFLGVGPEYMERSGKVWILNSWQIIVERYPKYGEQITVGTGLMILEVLWECVILLSMMRPGAGWRELIRCGLWSILPREGR